MNVQGAAVVSSGNSRSKGIKPVYFPTLCSHTRSNCLPLKSLRLGPNQQYPCVDLFAQKSDRRKRRHLLGIICTSLGLYSLLPISSYLFLCLFPFC